MTRVTRRLKLNPPSARPADNLCRPQETMGAMLMMVTARLPRGRLVSLLFVFATQIPPTFTQSCFSGVIKDDEEEKGDADQEEKEEGEASQVVHDSDSDGE